ncbi:MAG TPA: D-alanine--poly(phosphoribitol) ligase [Erysipelotrichaceae bacterium]|nr:D-alanine--poly(phosphoribitol) ligase [Erysipelotrichaceae bacterium]
MDSMKNVYELLQRSARCYPDAIALSNGRDTCTFEQLHNSVRQLGSGIAAYSRQSPVIIFLDHDLPAVISMLGIALSGNSYCIFNTDLPDLRLQAMERALSARYVITDQAHMQRAMELFPNQKILRYESLISSEINTSLLQECLENQIDLDPLYINFTSGSTGIPKGVIINHRSVLDFIPTFDDLFHITNQDVLANQAPFDFDVCVKDIYTMLNVGATLVLVPRALFSQPAPLLDFLSDQKVTTMIWAVSALTLISVYHGLDYRVPEYVDKILFSGEMMPYKHLKNYLDHMPETMFVNLYGPTEITCNALYHIIDRHRDYAKELPIGKPFPNKRVELRQNGKRISEPYTIGEIYVSGSCLALGYLNHESPAFIEENTRGYKERYYSTGDLAYLNKQGEYVFKGRSDFQIKYMGHRIELEEIDQMLLHQKDVQASCALFDQEKEKLIAYYIGDIDHKTLKSQLLKELPRFMIPAKLMQLDSFPLNKNGKLDRKKLMEDYHGSYRKHV